MRRQKATNHIKETYKQCMFATVNKLFDTNFNERRGTEFINFYHDMQIRQKQQLFDQLAINLNEDRKSIYKFFNNTFLPSIQPQLSEDVIEQIDSLTEAAVI